MVSKNQSQAGFTLPELIVVAGILLIFVVVGAILISPKSDSTELRNAQRRLDVAAITQALNRYVDDTGQLPQGISGEEQFIGAGEGESDLCSVLVPEYAEDLPFDPLSQSLSEATSCSGEQYDYITAYAIKKSDGGVTVTAPLTEAAEQFELTSKYD